MGSGTVLDSELPTKKLIAELCLRHNASQNENSALKEEHSAWKKENKVLEFNFSRVNLLVSGERVKSECERPD